MINCLTECPYIKITGENKFFCSFIRLKHCPLMQAHYVPLNVIVPGDIVPTSDKKGGKKNV